MAFPQCVIGSPTELGAILGDSTDVGTGLDVSVLAGTLVKFTPNIAEGSLLVLSGGMYIVRSVKAMIDSAGKLVGPNGSEGVALLANDPELGFILKWTVSFTNTKVRGVDVQLQSWAFDSPTDGETVGLDEIPHVVGVKAIGTTRGPKGDPGDPVDDVALVGDDVQFYVQGTPIGDPLALTITDLTGIDGGTPSDPGATIIDGGTP